MKRGIIFLLVFFMCLAGCGKKAEELPSSSNIPKDASKASEAEWQAALGNEHNQPFNPLLVYKDKGSKDNHYIPSGFMPDGQCVKLNDAWIEGCHSGQTCIKIVYDIECSLNTQKWAGVYWQNPANNWGNRKGGFNLTGATRLTFWAKGEKGGERIEEFKIGGITGDYPDSDSALIGPVILTNEWREYTVDLRAKDLSYINGGFSWSTNVDVNPETCTFYLDDIKYESNGDQPPGQ